MAHHRTQVRLVPGGEVAAVVVARFRERPAIEGLDLQEKAEPVAKLDKFGRGRVVAGTDGVNPGRAQDFELTLHRAHVDGRAERAEVVVQADALEGHPPVVEQKAARRVKADRADAEGGLDAIPQATVLAEGGHGDVAPGSVEVPELRSRHLEAEGGERGAAGEGAVFLHGRFGHGGAGGAAVSTEFVERHHDLEFGGRGTVVGEIDPHLDGRRLGSDDRRGGKHAPVLHVDGRGFHQPDVAIDATAGIPARRRGRVVEADGKDVVRAGPQVGREIQAEGGVAVGPAADEVAV